MKFLKFLLLSFLSLMAFDSCSQSLQSPIVNAPPPASGMPVVINPLVEAPVVIANNSQKGWIKLQLDHSSVILGNDLDVNQPKWSFSDLSVVFEDGTNETDDDPIIKINYGVSARFEFDLIMTNGYSAKTNGFLYVDDGTGGFDEGALIYFIPRVQFAYVPTGKLSYTDDTFTQEITANEFWLDYNNDLVFEHESPDNPPWTDELSPGNYTPTYYVNNQSIWPTPVSDYFAQLMFKLI